MVVKTNFRTITKNYTTDSDQVHKNRFYSRLNSQGHSDSVGVEIETFWPR